jgi:hypothetical protein
VCYLKAIPAVSPTGPIASITEWSALPIPFNSRVGYTLRLDKYREPSPESHPGNINARSINHPNQKDKAPS